MIWTNKELLEQVFEILEIKNIKLNKWQVKHILANRNKSPQFFKNMYPSQYEDVKRLLKIYELINKIGLREYKRINHDKWLREKPEPLINNKKMVLNLNENYLFKELNLQDNIITMFVGVPFKEYPDFYLVKTKNYITSVNRWGSYWRYTKL